MCQAEDGIRYLVRSRGLGDVYKRQTPLSPTTGVRLYELARQIYGERWDRDKERQVAEGASKGAVGKLADLTQSEGERSVSYTHLTLPTSDLV